MFKNKKNILIVIIVLLIITSVVYFLGIRPISNRDDLGQISDNINDLSLNSNDILDFPEIDSIFDSPEDRDFELVNLDPVLIDKTDDYNVYKIPLDVVFQNPYIDKINESSDLEIGKLLLDNESLADIIVLQDLNTKLFDYPNIQLEELFEFDYNSVKYWLYSNAGEGDLYISLENFENPRQVLIQDNPLRANSIKELADGEFWITTNGDDLVSRLIKLDFNLIPFDKWSDLDFLDERINSIRLFNSVDNEQLQNDINEFLEDSGDEIIEYQTDYDLFNFFPVDNGKILIQVPGVSNQLWLVDGDRNSLIKLDITFDAGDGLITCDNPDNVCIVYYRDIGLFRIDLNGSQPSAVNISPTIVDSGDGIIRDNIEQSFDELGRDSEKLLDYEDGKVYIWYQGGRFILGDFENSSN